MIFNSDVYDRWQEEMKLRFMVKEKNVTMLLNICSIVVLSTCVNALFFFIFIELAMNCVRKARGVLFECNLFFIIIEIYFAHLRFFFY